MVRLREKPAATGAYGTDLHAWAGEQARLLRAGRMSDVDLEHVAEEIESLGSEQRHALESQYARLIARLLKWRHQHPARSTSWAVSILDARSEILRRETRNPSLKARARDIVGDMYPTARRQAALETGLSLSSFPTDCPFSLDQLRDPDFMPE